MGFNFQVSSNDDEYEAFLVGLCLAREDEEQYISAFSDSLLITNQVNGTYEAKD